MVEAADDGAALTFSASETLRDAITWRTTAPGATTPQPCAGTKITRSNLHPTSVASACRGALRRHKAQRASATRRIALATLTRPASVHRGEEAAFYGGSCSARVDRQYASTWWLTPGCDVRFRHWAWVVWGSCRCRG
jgi:hypothetical protein